VDVSYAEALLDVQPHQHGQVAVSSRDPTLTAYAQLVALRLNAKRALVSLIDESNHYFVAEATQTLSLQADDVHHLADGLRFGATVVPRKGDFFCATLVLQENLPGPGNCAPFVVPDLHADEQYSQHELVVDGSHSSYAGVPLVAPSGYAIGVLSFLDNKPRPGGLPEDQITFMHDVATTIVSHLELARTKKAYGRGLRMAQGLGRFIEGKETLNDDELAPYRNIQDMQTRQATQTSGLGGSTRTHAMNDATNTERVDDVLRRQFGSDADSQTSAISASSARHAAHRRSESTHKSPTRRKISADAAIQVPSPDMSDLSTNLNDHLQEDLLSKDVRASFERAAMIVKDALDLSGVVFLDASIGEFGRLHSTDATSSAPEASEATTSAASDTEPTKTTTSGQDKGEETKPCRLLGSAYDKASIPGKVAHNGVPERLLKSLMRRFPFGKIWNFDAEGNASSSGGETSDGNMSKDRSLNAAASGEKKKRRMKSSHAPVLRDLFPGVRTLGLMPMWDSKRERFFAGAVVWSYQQTRILSFQEDLNYLGAFSDVIMAEVGRLDAQGEASTKKTFMSSISHELKTPLHGILGAVECLQDKENAMLQEEMLQMIDASARSLLDIVHNLIAHADARSMPSKNELKHSSTPASRKGSPPPRNRRKKASAPLREEPTSDIVALTEEVLDIACWTNPQPSPHSYSSHSDVERTFDPSDETGRRNAPLKVILNVEGHESNWNFHANPGGFRRILLNLISNSIKYTDKGGFVKISLTLQKRDPSDTQGTTMVHLACADSGRGMSQHYLDHGLWKAFSQEDSHSQGTGLGLSLVRDLVRDMRGNIEVQSTKDVGTEIKISLPLVPGPSSGTLPENVVSTATSERLQSSTYSILGFDGWSNAPEREAQATGALRQSIEKGCSSLGLQVAEHTSEATVFILSEWKAVELIEGNNTSSLTEQAANKPVIVLCYSAASARSLSALMSTNFPFAKAVSQPLGPRKLSRALAACLEMQIPLSPEQPDASPSRKRRFAGVDSSTPGMMPQAGSESDEISPTSTVTTSRAAKQKEAKPESPPDSARRDPAGSSELCVLLVDDNKLNLKLLETFMKKHGHSYRTACNGQEAVNILKDMYQKSESPLPPPMIILMDITMPVMDGFEATRQIRKYERTRALEPATIIALTAMGSADARQEAFSSGLNMFMTKPIRLRDVSSILAEHQDRIKRLKEVDEG